MEEVTGEMIESESELEIDLVWKLCNMHLELRWYHMTERLLRLFHFIKVKRGGQSVRSIGY